MSKNYSVTTLVPSITNTSLEKGEMKTESILFNNSGNSADYVALEFLDTGDPVLAYPQVNYIRVEAGESVKYPIIVFAAGNAPKVLHTLRYRIFSMADESSAVEGDLNIRVVKEKTNGGAGIGTMNLMMGLMVMFFGLCSLFMITGLNPTSKDGSNILRAVKGSPLAVVIGIVILLSLLPSSVTGFTGEITYDGDGDLDPSPMTSEELAVTTRWITLTSTDVVEQVVEITVDAGDAIPSFNTFQRVPAGSSTSFQLHIIVPKGSPSTEHVVVVTAHTVEREGIEIEDGGSVATNFFVHSLSYSLPTIKHLGEPYRVGDNSDGSSFNFRITNHGNGDDSFLASVMVREGEAENIDFEFSKNATSIPLGDQHQEDVAVFINSGLNDIKVFSYGVSGNETEEPVARATFIIVPEPDEKDDSVVESTEFVAGSMVLIVIIIVIVVLFVVRRKKSMEEEEEISWTDGEDDQATMDEVIVGTVQEEGGQHGRRRRARFGK